MRQINAIYLARCVQSCPDLHIQSMKDVNLSFDTPNFFTRVVTGSNPRVSLNFDHSISFDFAYGTIVSRCLNLIDELIPGQINDTYGIPFNNKHVALQTGDLKEYDWIYWHIQDGKTTCLSHSRELPFVVGDDFFTFCQWVQQHCYTAAHRN